mmetsp:Transcript_4141/g.7247  ORF Transcript_4141/g.7247 Transcript_4141/m.7247 type:complete len:93 (-) Transcript_4141:168-446(-)
MTHPGSPPGWAVEKTDRQFVASNDLVRPTSFGGDVTEPSRDVREEDESRDEGMSVFGERRRWDASRLLTPPWLRFVSTSDWSARWVGPLGVT